MTHSATTVARARVLRPAFVGLMLLLSAAWTSALELITKEEAARPPGMRIDLRGPFPGPTIEIVSPPSDVRQVSPIRLLARFTTYAGTEVDKETVRLIYIKTPLIELTDRVRDFITTKGIDLNNAEVPPGIHTIRIQLKDSAGRTGSTYLTFVIVR